MKKRIGLIVNPVAGMGGRVGLKGTDGPDILKRARELGAVLESVHRAIDALSRVIDLNDKIDLVTYPAEMGEDVARALGLSATVIGTITAGATTATDTERAAREMERSRIDLLLFAGGDGTARNICNAIGTRLLALGIPTGVKMHSAVFATTPRNAGEILSLYVKGTTMGAREAEVMDIDEGAFRNGVVTARLYGYLRVPEYRRFLQRAKSGGFLSEESVLAGIAADVITGMEDDVWYIIGPGTTTRAIMDRLGLQNTLLGVDIVRNKTLVASDVSERQILDIIGGRPARIVVTAIGGQGHVFGRGNQQISAAVIRAAGVNNVIVIAAKEKLISLIGAPLLVDTGDEQLNEELSGYIRVTTGFKEYTMYKVEH